MNFTPEQRAIRQWLSKPAPWSDACGCMGPLENQPRCPCAMGYVEEVDGKWYEITEHRSPDGITHTATYIGDVGKPIDPVKEDCIKILKKADTETFSSRVHAIKLHRALTGSSLKVAVDQINEWVKELS
jgi:hypothetical protein